MKRKIFIYAIFAIILSGCTNKPTSTEIEMEHRIYTRVAASFNYDYIGIHEEPNDASKVIDVLYGTSRGINSGVLIEKWDEWCQIRNGKTIGYVETKKADFQDWYSANGDKVLIADKDRTPIYGESYGDQESMPIEDFVDKGTIITDNLNYAGGYYMLITAHDYLYVSENDIKIVDKKNLGKIIQ